MISTWAQMRIAILLLILCPAMYSLDVVDVKRSPVEIDKTPGDLVGKKLSQIYNVSAISISQHGKPGLSHEEIVELYKKLEYLDFNVGSPPINDSWGPSINNAYQILIHDKDRVIGMIIIFESKIGVLIHYRNGIEMHSLVGLTSQ